MNTNHPATDAPQDEEPSKHGWLKKLPFRKRAPASLRTVIEDFIEKADEDEGSDGNNPAAQEETLISNILQLRDLTAFDVMIPRAEICAIPETISREDLIDFVRENPLSRFPVYKGALDDIVGSVHIKDLFLALAPNDTVFDLKPLIREVPIISPALPVMDILHTMRTTRRHMMLVVDEYGGIDGLVTAGDMVEAIIGRLDDEHDTHDEPQLILRSDGSAIADARLPIVEFEDQFGEILAEEERDGIDTLGGLIMSTAGRIPARGEILRHDSGIEFEILDADPRRVIRVLIRKPKAA